MNSFPAPHCKNLLQSKGCGSRSSYAQSSLNVFVIMQLFVSKTELLLLLLLLLMLLLLTEELFLLFGFGFGFDENILCPERQNEKDDIDQQSLFNMMNNLTLRNLLHKGIR